MWYSINNVGVSCAGHSHSENDNAHSFLDRILYISRRNTIYTPAIIPCDFKKNECSLEVIEHNDVINFISWIPTCAARQTEEKITEEEKKKKALIEKLGISKRKVTKSKCFSQR